MRGDGRRTILTAVLLCAAWCGCGDGDNREPRPSQSPTPSPSPTVSVLTGIYDATVVAVGNTSAPLTTMGVVDTFGNEVDVSVQLGSDRSFEFGGPITADGMVTGDGDLLVTDFGVSGAGTAMFAERDGVAVVTGTFTTEPGTIEFENDTFELTRPLGTDAAVFDGTYRFAFAQSPSPCGCPSTIDVNLAFEASGMGTATASVERGQDGRALVSVTDGSAEISPNGRLRVALGYRTTMASLPIFGLLLVGEVHPAGAGTTGKGDAFYGGFSFDLRAGSWTVEQLP
jgi:hypothetical protein